VVLRDESAASEELVPLVLLRSDDEVELGVVEVDDVEVGEDDVLRLVSLARDESVLARLESVELREPLPVTEPLALPLPLSELLVVEEALLLVFELLLREAEPLPDVEPLPEREALLPVDAELFAVLEDAVLFCVLKSDGELEVEDALLVGLEDVELYDVLLLLLILVFEVVLLLAEPEPESEPLAEVEPLAP